MIQENRILLETILSKLPTISKFINPEASNKSDERFEQVFEGIFEGFSFATRNEADLNQLLEIVEEKLINNTNKLLSASGIITSNSIINYNVSDTGITVSSSLKDGKNNDPLKLNIKKVADRSGTTLTVTYGEVPANADQYANGISTRNRGGATIVSCDKEGNITEFDQLFDKDTRQTLEISNRTESVYTEEELEQIRISEIEEMWHEWAEVHHTDY